jgi:GNAT superfamily N-acetyltransferase
MMALTRDERSICRHPAAAVLLRVVRRGDHAAPHPRVLGVLGSSVGERVRAVRHVGRVTPVSRTPLREPHQGSGGTVRRPGVAGLPARRSRRPPQPGGHRGLRRHLPGGLLRVPRRRQGRGQGAGIFLDFDFDHIQHRIVDITGEHQCLKHDWDGDWYYGTDIVVHPDYRRRGIGKRLVRTSQGRRREHNKRGIIAGGHMPGYVDHKDGCRSRTMSRPSSRPGDLRLPPSPSRWTMGSRSAACSTTTCGTRPPMTHRP